MNLNPQTIELDKLLFMLSEAQQNGKQEIKLSDYIVSEETILHLLQKENITNIHMDLYFGETTPIFILTIKW